VTTAAEQAARNNARWCDTVCRAHGSAGEFGAGYWLHRRAGPPFYPNLVTCRGDVDTGRVLDEIHALRAAALPIPWGVKDSFCALDLTQHGFELLFEARWLCCDVAASVPVPSAAARLLTWSTVADAAHLAAWERGWSLANAIVQAPVRQFPDSLLADRELRFIAGYRDSALVAGAILNRSEAEVGVSNTFTADPGRAIPWPDLIHQARRAFGSLPIVGYEQGSNVAHACRAGFDDVGALRVWLAAALETP
jgi:hypothetical protein